MAKNQCVLRTGSRPQTAEYPSSTLGLALAHLRSCLSRLHETGDGGGGGGWLSVY